MSSIFKHCNGCMLFRNDVALLLLLMMPLARQSSALSLPSEKFMGYRLTIKSGVQQTSQVHFRMADEIFYNPYSKGEPMNGDGYYNRGQSPLARLAQQSQTRQKAPTTTDLQSTIKHELDMMEEKLLQFQETSIRQSHAMLDQLELFSREDRFRREQGQGRLHEAAFASSDEPFIGSFATDVEGTIDCCQFFPTFLTFTFTH